MFILGKDNPAASAARTVGANLMAILSGRAGVGKVMEKQGIGNREQVFEGTQWLSGTFGASPNARLGDGVPIWCQISRPIVAIGE